MSKIIKHKLQIISGFLLIFYICIAYQIPYAHDDWYWGIGDGIAYLFNAKLNSRYLGNAIVVILTRSELIKTVIMGLVFWLIPIVMTKIAINENKERALQVYIVCNMIPALLHRFVYIQTYNWVSGFVNYVISALLLLVHFLIIQELFDSNKDKNKVAIYQLVGLFIFSISIQLFLENIAVVMVLFSIITLIYSIKNKINIIKYVTILAGNIVGMIIMFSSSMYKTLINDGESLGGLREVLINKDAGFSGIKSIIENINHGIVSYMIALLFVFYIILTFLALYLTAKKHNNISTTLKITLMVSIPLLWFSMMITYNAILYILFLILVFIDFYKCIDNKLVRNKSLCMYIAHIVVISPLAVIGLGNTNIHRLFLTPSIFLMTMIVLILHSEIVNVSEKKYKIITCITLIILALGLLHYGKIYYNIGKTNKDIQKTIDTTIQTSSDKLYFIESEYYEKYLYGAYPVEGRKDYFKIFYNLDKSVELIVPNKNAER